MRLFFLLQFTNAIVIFAINSFNGNIIIVDGPYHPMSLMQNANGRLDPTDGRGNIVVHRRLSPTMIK
ncbi:Uncharacterized protein BM_BM1193 [Brugia malayi]|uniref:Bm1193, isoform b n=1 Tax=Brugia malayi TaxID=6279 RepID=A0A1P6BJ18_BRUMA|nr:Uncharacterized protein BM_BM1193 [Brugia malayi]CDQ03515.1 Bm1193, isoform b [Brugia malayi]VIO95825.1 Uncharacterized protein BM_BM1193 [Brugia malayi]